MLVQSSILLLALSLGFTSRCSGQIPDSVRTIPDAQRFAGDRLGEDVTIFDLGYTGIESELHQMMKGQPVGYNVFFRGQQYKILLDTIKTYFRASYIYLDGSKLSQTSIKELRGKILALVSDESTFRKTVPFYIMDGNPTGDTGFFKRE